MTTNTELSRRDFDALRTLIFDLSGISLSDAKQALVAGRIRPRMRALGLESFHEYVELVSSRNGSSEHEELVSCITTNKTSFFRESHHFDFLREQIIAHRGPRKLRLWSAACSTGEEPWSIAMTVADAVGSLAGWDIKILASDLDRKVLATAERAVYSEESLAEIPAALRAKYWEGNRVGPALRSLVTFRPMNLVAPQTWSFRAKFDVIFCRNVAIYFDRETQETLFSSLASVLAPHGHLMSGHSENLHWLSHVLRPAGNTIHVHANTPKASPTEVTREVAIQVGGIHASAKDIRIRTTLGSCVAVCLFDPVARVGGMNHFLLPDGQSGVRGPTNFGVHAMEVLVNSVLKLGGQRARLQAKVFGGADLGTSTRVSVGHRNSEFAISYLAEESIPVVAQKLGGSTGMMVAFDTASGRALVKSLERSPTLSREESDYVESLRAKNKTEVEDIVFFGN